jgi:hypothetical protein
VFHEGQCTVEVKRRYVNKLTVRRLVESFVRMCMDSMVNGPAAPKHVGWFYFVAEIYSN